MIYIGTAPVWMLAETSFTAPVLIFFIQIMINSDEYVNPGLTFYIGEDSNDSSKNVHKRSPWQTSGTEQILNIVLKYDISSFTRVHCD